MRRPDVGQWECCRWHLYRNSPVINRRGAYAFFMMRMTVLASGSKGNSTLVSSSRTRILVDAGLSCRELLKRMHLADEDPAAIDALLITHEHQDHVQGVAVLARKRLHASRRGAGAVDEEDVALGFPLRASTGSRPGDAENRPRLGAPIRPEERTKRLRARH